MNKCQICDEVKGYNLCKTCKGFICFGCFGRICFNQDFFKCPHCRTVRNIRESEKRYIKVEIEGDYISEITRLIEKNGIDMTDTEELNMFLWSVNFIPSMTEEERDLYRHGDCIECQDRKGFYGYPRCKRCYYRFMSDVRKQIIPVNQIVCLL